MGCSGWSYEDVLPFFKQSEAYTGRGGDDRLRGRDGPMAVEEYRTVLPATHAFVRAAEEAGIPRTPDYNGAVQEGVGYSQNSRRVRFRASTARAFLAPARGRAKLRVESDVLVCRLTFEGKRCTGDEFRRGDRACVASSAREVIVCGGAIGSPHLLQISGVGAPEHLREIGVGVMHSSPK